ncbi:MAG: hypothetical protein ACP5E3_00775, partial [Bacteroidales bacterium]
MKRLYLLSVVLLMAFGSNLFAGSGDLFSYDKVAVETELAELTEIENYVASNPETTLSLLKTDNNQLLTGLNLYSPYAMGMNLDDPPLGIPSFLWGCVFSVAGVVIVYLVTDEDKDETKKAFFGCIANAVVYGVTYAVLIAIY